VEYLQFRAFQLSHKKKELARFGAQALEESMESGPDAQNAAPIGAAFWGPALPLASQTVVAGGFFHLTYCRHPRPVHPYLRAASLAVALAERLLFLAVQSSEAAGTSLAPI
jgi:hypothetical protein